MPLEMQFITYEWNAGGTEVQTFTPALDVPVLAEYLTQSPPQEMAWTRGMQIAPLQHTVGNAVETVRIITNSAPYTFMTAIKGVLRRAQYWAEQSLHDRRVMVRVRDTDRSATWYSSRLWGGSVKLERGPYLTLELIRAPYWEAAEAVVQVKNISTLNVFADTALIADRDDATDSNWVACAPVAGDVPTPLRLVVTDGLIAPANLGELRVGWDQSAYSINLEGEYSLLPKTVVVDADYSQGAWAYALEFYWQVLVPYSGPFKILAKGDLSGANCYVELGFSSAVYQGETVAGVNGWTDLGIFVLPPGGQVHPARLPFYVWLKQAAGGLITTFDLDYLLLMPLRQFRYLSFPDARPSLWLQIEDDAWWQEAAAINVLGRSAEVDAWGDSMYLWPTSLLPDAATQMLVFTQEDYNGLVESTRQATVQLYARARYEALP